jgi:hypothetical protein
VNDPRDNVFVRDLRGCARCGGDHTDLVFIKLTIPSFDGEWTHWTHCPTNGEPIMMGIEKDEDKGLV